MTTQPSDPSEAPPPAPDPSSSASASSEGAPRPPVCAAVPRRSAVSTPSVSAPSAALGVGVTAAHGFRASGIAAGIKASGLADLALVVNDGPSRAAAAVFTSNRVKAAPVLWTRAGRSRAASSTPSSSTPAAPTPAPAPWDSRTRTPPPSTSPRCSAPRPPRIAVCSTGLIGVRLPMDRLLGRPVRLRRRALRHRRVRRGRGRGHPHHRHASPRPPSSSGPATSSAAWPRAPACSPRAWPPCSCVLTTDADVPHRELDAALRVATARTFDRIDSDGCMSTNDTVIADGLRRLRRRAGTGRVRRRASTAVCADLARQLIADAEGASKEIEIEIVNAASEADAARGRPARSPATTCSSAPSTARTRTGAGCCPRSAPRAPRSSRTSCPSRSTASGSAATAASARTANCAT